jgi:hypothetical protein
MRLQAAPQGLLGALTLKQHGDNPGEFSPELVPVYEARGFYDLPMLLGRVIDTLAATNVGDTAEQRVPPGEVWRVKYVGIVLSAFTAPAATVRASLNAIVDPASVPIMPDVAGAVAAANDQMAGGIVPAGDGLLMPPDSRLVATLRNDLGAVTCTLSMRIVYARYPT